MDISSERKHITERYYKSIGSYPDLDNPRSFTEKIQWIKLNERFPLRKHVADKYDVRKYISAKIGDKYLNDVYWIGNDLNNIDISQMPDMFVVKATHSCKCNIFVKDKNIFDLNDHIVTINEWLDSDYYYAGYEWAYKDLPKRIMFEKYIDIDKEYKFYVMNGKVKMIVVNITKDNYVEYCKIYDRGWNEYKFEYVHPIGIDKIVPPALLPEGIELAERIGEDFSFIRVDTYIDDNRIVMGELTNYPTNGFVVIKPRIYDYMLGDCLNLY